MPDRPCRACGNWISDKSIYKSCLKCGTPLEETKSSVAPASSASGSASTRSNYCPNCGSQLVADARFCSNCAAPIQSPAPPVLPPAERGTGPLLTSAAKPESSRGRKAALVIGAGALIYVLVVMGPGAAQQARREAAASAAPPKPPASASATAAPHVGSVVEAGNWRYQVRKVDVTKTSTTGSGILTASRTAKGTWVIVQIELTNIGNRNYSINTHDFELRDDKGTRYDPEASYVFNLPPGHMNFGEQTPPGVPLLATLYFDVSPGTTGMYLYLSNVGLFEKPPVIYLY